MKPVESSVVINRPLEECFAYLADLANDLEWRREWIDAEKTTDGPHGVGARYRLTGALLGRRIATEYETIAYEPNRLAAWKAVSGPLALTFSRLEWSRTLDDRPPAIARVPREPRVADDVDAHENPDPQSACCRF
jgi:hypothetical protein